MTARRLCGAARIVGTASIAFLSLLALDVFQPGMPLGLVPIGPAIHLIPSVVLVLITVMAWRRPPIGGLPFIADSVMSHRSGAC